MPQALAAAERLASGGRVQRLAGGEKMLGANDVFRLWRDDGTVILKVYGTDARARREAHALEALGDRPGLPALLDTGTEEDRHWALFGDAGRWSLGTLPDNPGLARKAGELLRSVHDTPQDAMSNLTRGIDQEWVAVDFVSTFRRLERYRGKLGISGDLLEAARAVRPPSASDARAAHTNPLPGGDLESLLLGVEAELGLRLLRRRRVAAEAGLHPSGTLDACRRDPHANGRTLVRVEERDREPGLLSAPLVRND